MGYWVVKTTEKNVESDLGLKDEMSFAIANLINMEEHLSLTIANSKNKDYIPILEEVRKLRAKYMKQYAGNELKFQNWCFLKHTLATAYRLIEVATKNIALGNNDNAIENMQDSKDLFELAFIITQI